MLLGQDADTPVFKGGVSDVRVDLQVLENGRLIENLTREDFKVYDNNVRRDIGFFGHEREPLSVVLLLDVSGSMGKFIKQLSAASSAALDQLREGDSISIMVFGREQKVTLPFTSRRPEVISALAEAVREKDVGSGTLINPALIAAAQYVRDNAKTGRRAIIIVTDNLALNYQSPDETAIRELHNANAVLNAIVVGKGNRPDEGPKSRYVNPEFSPANVFKIAEETGGEAIKAARMDEAFPALMERIRARYSLLYGAPLGRSGEYREIRVEFTPEAKLRYPNAIIRSRKGYVVQ